MTSSTAVTILRFISYTLGLIIIGAVFGVIGAFVGGRVLGEGDFAALGLAVLGLFLGYFLGIVIGLILVKLLLHQRGSLLFGIIGGIIGAVIPLVIIFLLKDGTVFFVYLPAISVPVLSLAGFYLKR
jgi:hypothetical protein